MTQSESRDYLTPSNMLEQKNRQEGRIASPPKSPVFQTNLSDLQEAISSAFQSFYECKIATSDEYLRKKLDKIANEDGVFYIATVQSIKHSNQIMSHAESVINYINKMKTAIIDANHHTIPKGLIRDCVDIKESVKGLRNDYDGVLRRLGYIQEELRRHKCDLSERIEEIPYYKTQLLIHQKKSIVHNLRSKNLFLFGGGVMFGAILIVICALGDVNESIVLPINLTMLMLGFVLVGVGIIFRISSCLHARESDRIDEELEYTSKLTATTNDKETRMIELNLIDVIFQLKMILAYWKKYQSNLENIAVELGHGDHVLSEQIEELWLTIKDRCETYNRVVGSILDHVDSVQGRQEREKKL
ncbi:4243_t:CDS:2 [Acaulospora morrowiae]|uniref:4243_t:CDS:1 n=1 Tax=Acaulospora morrowiae TaxID=94023 RepID=A0A9N9N7V6_9GLOM|nr:4243_t:CDS:2 [Acaulospora morrowiae]